MENIGLSLSEQQLCRKITADANLYWRSKDMVVSGKGSQLDVDTVCESIQKSLFEINALSNFHLLMTAERIMCLADLEHYQRSRQNNPNAFSLSITLSTLREAVNQMEEINDNLTFRERDIHAFHSISSRTRIQKSEHDSAGLPKDAIRKLLSSHMTRLRNKATGIDGASNGEETLLWHRHRNIQTAERLYKTMQREALGIEDKSRNRDHQR